MQSLLETNLDYLLFLHGFALVILGTYAMVLARMEERPAWRCLGTFSFAQAAFVWLQMVALDWGDTPIIAALRQAALAGSVLLLFAAARGGIIRRPSGRSTRWPYVLLAGVTAPLAWYGGVEAAISVLVIVGIAGSFLAIRLLWSWNQGQPPSPTRRLLRYSILGLSAYLAGRWLELLLARVLNPGATPSMPTDPLTEVLLGALAAGVCAGFVRPCRQLLQRSLGDEQKTARTRRELMILGGLALTIAVGWLTADLAGHHQDSTMRRQVLVRTELGAATIETDLVRQLHWNEQDLSNPAYLHLKHLMRAFPRANPDLRFAELMGVREGRTYFLADSEPPNSPDYSPPGQFYEEAEASYLAAVARHEPFVLGPIADRWGVWITASVPVVDLNQDRSWVTFDLDLSADGWDARIRQARLPVILITLLLAVLGVMFHQAQEQIRATLAQVVQSEQALLAAKEAAEAATRAKSDFLAVMSHEIRTPIGGVIGLLDMLRRLPQPTQQRYYTDLARDNAEALLEILDDVLDTAKVESGKLSFESIPFRLRAEFHRVLEALRLRAEAKGLALEWKVDPDVPEVLTGDPTRLRQIVANLVSNAIKFTARGGIHVTAQRDPVIAGDTRAQLRVSVRDTGIGIPPEAQTRLFAKFEQADASTTRQYGGTGLGLAIVKNLVERMAGNIAIESAVGAGTTFICTLRLPIGSAEEMAGLEPADLQAAALTRHACHLRLLGAEDNSTNREIMRFIVEQMGHEIVFAENGREAVDWLRRECFDAVLMDNRMPVMDGFQATRLIRDPAAAVRDREVYIIAVTANASQTYRAECLEAGMNDYLTKPVREAALHAALGRAIDHQQHRGFRLPAMPPAQEAGETPPAGMSEAELTAAVTAESEPGGPEAQFSPATLRKIARQFLQETPLLLAAMRTALQTGDAVTLGRGAHSLKSTSWYVRGDRLRAVAAELETCADAGRQDELGPLLDRVEHEFALLRPELDAKLTEFEPVAP